MTTLAHPSGKQLDDSKRTQSRTQVHGKFDSRQTTSKALKLVSQ